jgi:hypothetical protein
VVVDADTHAVIYPYNRGGPVRSDSFFDF